jgi:hypothetical protein
MPTVFIKSSLINLSEFIQYVWLRALGGCFEVDGVVVRDCYICDNSLMTSFNRWKVVYGDGLYDEG